MARSIDVVQQAGGIAFRLTRGVPSILLVTSRRDPSHWIFPKGHIEEGESAGETALRETQEEAGVDGTVVGPVGKPLLFKWNGRKFRVKYFLIRATSESPSSEGRKKAWLPLDAALTRLSFADLQALLRAAAPGMKGRP
jgi:8-oxo-dGTP pyrophosphatase MutT (NUDIX family)